MWRFLAKAGKPDLVVYLFTIIFVWLAPGIATAETIHHRPATSIDGEAILGVTSYGGVLPTASRVGSDILTNYRLRVNIKTTFSGKDRLKIQFQSSDSTPLNTSVTGTNMTRSSYDATKGKSTILSILQYTLPLDPQTKLTVDVTGCAFSDNLKNFNPLLANAGSGATSRFGRYNPIYRLSSDGMGITLDRQLTPNLNFTLGYSVPSLIAANPSTSNGSNVFIGQLSYRANSKLDLGLTYARAYNNNGSGIMGNTGSAGANNPFNGDRTSAHHYSLSANYQLSPQISISGWVGATDARREAVGGGSAKIGNIALTLVITDVGGVGNTLGFVVGIPPKLIDRSNGSSDLGTSLHLEALYRIKIDNNLEITPSILLITNPEHNSSNSPIYVGSIRTTFRF